MFFVGVVDEDHQVMLDCFVGYVVTKVGQSNSEG